jgi:hypothetical protein
MVQIDSTNIEQFGYSVKNQEFVVRFLNNTAYVYKDVPVDVAVESFSAPSIGSWMHRNLKGFYRFESIDSMLNLCDSCVVGCPAECKGLQAFGKGHGNDNIYYCDGYERRAQ